MQLTEKKIVPRLSEVVLVETALYGYTYRVGSICNPTEPDKRLLRDNLAAIRHLEGAVGEWGEELAAYAPVKVAWLYSGLCTRTLVFGERAVWETYLGEPRRFVRENRGALLRAMREGWLSPRVACGLVAKAWLPQAWLADGAYLGGCGVTGEWDSLVANVDLNGRRYVSNSYNAVSGQQQLEHNGSKAMLTLSNIA